MCENVVNVCSIYGHNAVSATSAPPLAKAQAEPSSKLDITYLRAFF
jgi:hypothetical protein